MQNKIETNYFDRWEKFRKLDFRVQCISKTNFVVYVTSCHQEPRQEGKQKQNKTKSYSKGDTEQVAGLCCSGSALARAKWYADLLLGTFFSLSCRTFITFITSEGGRGDRLLFLLS